MIREIEILQHEDCQEIISKVHALESKWISRVATLPFFTLGAASYMDAVKEPERYYYPVARETNPILWNQFQGIYENVLNTLSQTLGQPAQFADRFALPGFHIFQGHRAFGKESMSIHFDLQYQLLDWQQVINECTPISFTLPILLPNAGAGLWHWDLSFKEMEDLSGAEKNSLIGSRNKSYYAYKEGVLMLHSGHELHQIAAMPEFLAGEERITLQGHGLLVDGIWLLYW